MALPAGSLVHLPYTTFRVSSDATLVCTEKGAVVIWPSLQELIENEKPEWITVEFCKPDGESDENFVKKTIKPLADFYGLRIPFDQLPGVHIYGSLKSPAMRTAAEQLRAIEPDHYKWGSLLNRFKTPEERQHYMGLWQRYVSCFQGRPPPPWIRFESGAPPAAPVGPPKKTLAEKISICELASVDSMDPRKIRIEEKDGNLLAEAISLSGDMVFATIYLDGGGFSNHYMPLRHFLELYQP